MRILYLLFSYTVGGTEQLVTDICNSMVEKQNDVYLYIVNNLIDEVMIQKLEAKVHVQRQNRTSGGSRKFETLINIAKFIKNKKIEVVHCNSLNAPELLILSKILQPKLKIVYTVHGMNQYCQLNKAKVLYRNIICNQIIAISESVKNDVISSGANESKVQVVYNAIDFKRMDNKNNLVHTFKSDSIVIGNAARFQPEIKGQDILFEAVENLVKRYPTIKCFFAGAPDDKHINVFKNLADKAKKRYPDNIIFLGNVDDIAAFLNQIDIFVLPSRSEGFGISLVEAMAMGVPCIASRLAGPEEVLEYGKKGKLFNPGDSNDLADAIEAVICNYKKEKKTAEENSYYVRKQYDIDNMSEKLLQIYSTL